MLRAFWLSLGHWNEAILVVSTVLLTKKPRLLELPRDRSHALNEFVQGRLLDERQHHDEPRRVLAVVGKAKARAKAVALPKMSDDDG